MAVSVSLQLGSGCGVRPGVIKKSRQGPWVLPHSGGEVGGRGPGQNAGDESAPFLVGSPHQGQVRWMAVEMKGPAEEHRGTEG